jgi:hypothetical protein
MLFDISLQWPSGLPAMEPDTHINQKRKSQCTGFSIRVSLPFMNITLTKWSIIAAAFVSILTFLFLPSEIYIRNPIEFVSTPSLLARDLLIWSGVAAIVLTVPALIPISGWQRSWLILLGSLAFAFWISGVFLVPDFGSMDGTSFHLERHTAILNVHTVIFIVALAGAAFGMWKWPGYMIGGLAVLGSGLVALTVNNFYSVSTRQDALFEPVDPAEIALFSSEKNVLILVLDTFQSDILQEITENLPGLRNALDGFQFFPDTLGVAPTTYLTMPAFHSGVSYDRLISLPAFYDQGIRQDSFLGELARNDYRVDIINPIAGVCPENVDVCKQQEHLLLNSRQVTETEALRLADLGIFRAIPGQFKRLVFQSGSGIASRIFDEIPLTGLEHRIYNANSILQMVADELTTTKRPSTAKLIHLLNTHPPFMFDAECAFIGVTQIIDRGHQTRQTECALKWVLYLFDAMKQGGVYDNSLIILTADTGAGSIHAEDDLSSLYAQEHGVAPGKLGRLIGGANPLLAIKQPGARGAMQTSTIQAQLTDIPKTVCASTGDCSNSLGLDLGSDRDELRARIYQYYQFKNEYWGLDYIPGITQYSVLGPLWLESSWTQSPDDGAPQEITRLNFSNEDDPGVFGAGWGVVETERENVSKRWAIAGQAELLLALPMGKNLVILFNIYQAPSANQQQMTLRINDQIIGSRTLREGLWDVYIPVPATVISDDQTRILLEFSELKSLENNDERELAAAFFSLVVYQQ